MRELASSLCVALVASALQATALLALAWLVERVFVRRVWPELLTTLWLVALARLVLPADLASPWSVTTALGEPVLALAESSTAHVSPLAVALIWIAGAATCIAARIVRRARIARSLVLVESAAWRDAVDRSARAFGVRRAPRIAVMAELSQPAVLGLLRPTLLLPASWLTRAPTRDDGHALLHELAHVARRDLWLDEACELVKALFWFHPLVWIAARRVRALTELGCDATVARRLGAQAPAYRASLVRAAAQLLASPAPAGSRAFVAHGSALVLRIERLQRVSRASLALMRTSCAALALALAACVLPMAAGDAALRRAAQRVFDAELSGAPVSCFQLRAAAMVLGADSQRPTASEE